MRALLVALTAAATLALPASAGTIDPKGLVLVEADLPAGFRLDPTESYVFSNARFAGDVPANKKLVARSERVTGYLARYDKGARGQLQTIQSSTHVFRRVGGARMVVLRFDTDQRKHNSKRGALLRDGRERTNVGDESWVYWSGYPGYFVMVTWRQARFLGVVASWGIGKARTLALARVQERRTAAELR